MGCDEQTTWSSWDGIISQIKEGLNSFQQLKGRIICLDLRWNRRASINKVYDLSDAIFAQNWIAGNTRHHDGHSIYTTWFADACAGKAWCGAVDALTQLFGSYHWSRSAPILHSQTDVFMQQQQLPNNGVSKHSRWPRSGRIIVLGAWASNIRSLYKKNDATA